MNKPLIMNGLDPVEPCRPAAPYVGGKRSLSRRLVQMIDAVEGQTIYAEPFVGMGGVFLRRQARPKIEAINDYAQDVANFFRMLQHHYVAFLDMLRFQITSRANFERLVATNPDTLTDLQRAARFLYLQRLAYGGRRNGQTYGVRADQKARFDVTRLPAELEDIHERLASVHVENLPWRKFVERYDREGALFYCDPPYHGTEGYYGDGLFDRSEFEELAEVLLAARGRVILTINDCEETRAIFADFDVDRVDARYTLAGMDKSRNFGELIVTKGL